MQQPRENIDEQAILSKLKRLSPQQKTEVLNFIDFLSARMSPSSLEHHLQTTPAGGTTLEEVRRRLAKIEGSMSQTIRSLCDERG